MNQLKSDLLESQLALLYGRINYERQLKLTPRNFKLANMSDLLGRLGNPHLTYPVIHVAGTKGKGSVTTMIGSVLSAAARRTGVYTSPHLESLHQRMSIDGRHITNAQLSAVLTEIGPVIEEMDRVAAADNHRRLTFFEVTTAAAFCFFAKEDVDAVVLEVGLGGRLDSTNVCSPCVTVITNISHDHTRQLGSTLGKIASQKAGIIKPGVPVISGVSGSDAEQVIAAVAREKKAALFRLDVDFRVGPSGDGRPASKKQASRADHLRSDDPPRIQFATSGKIGQFDYEFHNVELNLLGQHQVTNAGIAVAAVGALNDQGWRIGENPIREGLSKTKLIGRAELISRKPTVLVDMAHNVASIGALVETLANQVPEFHSAAQRTLIFSTSREKDTRGMLEPLIGLFDRIILTQYQNNPRGSSPESLSVIASELVKRHCRPIGLQTAKVPLEAWATAVESVSADEFICIAGSAFLVAELRPVIMDWSQCAATGL